MKKIIAPVLLTFLVGACASKQQEPVAPPPPPPPAPTKAQAVFTSAKGSKIKGTIHFTEEAGEIKVEGDIEGLKKGPHGFHIHENGDCSAADFNTAGGHFNPSGNKHGSLSSTTRHAGDMGNVVASKKGKATVNLTIKGALNGPEGIIGKSIIIHKGKDDLKSQPAGNSGPKEACGIIEAL